VINRDDEKTRQIVAKFGFESAKISELKKELVDADVLIVATGAQGYTITADVINPRKELLILDMSMPRNADPKLVELSQVRLVHIDELSKAANIRLGDRFNHIPKAEKIVLEEIEEFSAWLQSLEIAPTLGLVTKNLRVFRDIEMTKITSGDEEEEKRMLLLTDKVIQKVTTQVATFLKTKSERPGEDMSLFEEVFQRPSNHDA
jgi:glutamyl-tRNA reductase